MAFRFPYSLMVNGMKRLVREPLVHFLVLGALLFVGYGLLNRNGEPAPAQIVVSQGQLASMVETFILVRQRAPTREEWEGLIRERVREEVYYREALALGLDKDDLIIRRRLQQKMQFISDDMAAQATPTDADLTAYLQAHPDKFRVEQKFTFRQLYLDPAKHGANLARDATQLLPKLNQVGGDADFVSLGDPFMLENKFTALPAREIANQFGKEFAAKLGEMQSDHWQGPVKSGFGVHLVFISERTNDRLPALAEVRDAVRREWDDARRAEANEKFYQRLLKQYTVTIEQPTAEAANKIAATK
jgi:hypothetical protein